MAHDPIYPTFSDAEYARRYSEVRSIKVRITRRFSLAQSTLTKSLCITKYVCVKTAAELVFNREPAAGEQPAKLEHLGGNLHEHFLNSCLT